MHELTDEDWFMNGLFIRLSTDVLTDEKVLGAGLEASMVYVKGLLYAKQHSTDGFIPDACLALLSIGAANPNEIYAALVKNKLWFREENGYNVGIDRWSKWQTTKEQIEIAKKDARGRKAKSRDSGSKKEINDQSHDGHKIVTNLSHESSVSEPEPEPEPYINSFSNELNSCEKENEEYDLFYDQSSDYQDPEPSPAPKKRGRPQKPIIDPNPYWDQFCSVYPQRLGQLDKPKGKQLFQKIVKEGARPEDIISGAKRYSDMLKTTGKFGTEFVKQMPTWFRASGWMDEYALPKTQESETRKPYDPERSKLLTR